MGQRNCCAQTIDGSHRRRQRNTEKQINIQNQSIDATLANDTFLHLY